MLGFFWSFVNPLLLLLTYGLVFTVILPGASDAGRWSRTSSSSSAGSCPGPGSRPRSLEASGVLIAGGNLIKKVLFPAEVLPVVTVLANLAHFLLGLPILLLCLVLLRPARPRARCSCPCPLLVQLVLTVGLALIVSALTVHFRDIQNILAHLAAPVVLRLPRALLLRRRGRARRATLLRLNPMSHVLVSYQQMLFDGHFDHWRGLVADRGGRRRWPSPLGAFLFDRLRDTLAEEV